MTAPALPADEAQRLATLREHAILDSPPEQAYDDLLRIAAAICRVPMGAVSLVDADRQWFKSRIGIDAAETPREYSFCAHAILEPDRMLVVEDAQDDARFRDNPLVLGDPNIRFYAGAPLSAGGQPLGAFCVMDDKPRQLDEEQLDALQALSRQASILLELRRLGRALNHQLRERAWYEQQLRAHQAELEAQNADLNEQTRTDPLTGLANRRAFAVGVEKAIAAASDASAPLHLAVVDIDHFKTINDLHGHVEGDRVLKAVGDVLGAQAGAARGRVARYGGEEFVLLLPDMPQDQARLQCEYLREAIAALPIGLPVTVSIGLASHHAGDTPESLFARADQALYAAKREGRDRVSVAE
jgi:diguanylate cyclase (GGDEF)-like protein